MQKHAFAGLTLTAMALGLGAGQAGASEDTCYEDEPCYWVANGGTPSAALLADWAEEGEPGSERFLSPQIPGSVAEAVYEDSPVYDYEVSVQASSTRTSVGVYALGLGYDYTPSQHQAIQDLLDWGAPGDEYTAQLVDIWMQNLLTLAEVYEALR